MTANVSVRHRWLQLRGAMCVYVALALIVSSLLGEASSAQPLYRYRDVDGHWVYTDRRSEALSDDVQSWDYRREVPLPEVTIERRAMAGGVLLVARNTFFSPIQLAWRTSNIENAVSANRASMSDNAVLDPRSETELLRLVPRAAGAAMRFELSYQYIPGAPGARHEPREPYRVPFALANTHRVSQAYPSALTHNDPANLHAVDFEMPIGTGVYAARGGTVIEIADDNYTAGLDPDTDLARANIVRILHEDGTMALYGHLNWNSIRVRPGQQIERGEYLADSGNTGFSTGPHLHFVVQRNAGGLIESVPVEFIGAGGTPVRLSTGDLATAY
jgi:murein DD-endopeptidase MepM/ murein hydrolase activator NlpD